MHIYWHYFCACASSSFLKEKDIDAMALLSIFNCFNFYLYLFSILTLPTLYSINCTMLLNLGCSSLENSLISGSLKVYAFWMSAIYTSTLNLSSFSTRYSQKYLGICPNFQGPPTRGWKLCSCCSLWANLWCPLRGQHNSKQCTCSSHCSQVCPS